MRIARVSAFGRPEDVIELFQQADPGSPGPGEVLIESEYAPINPADTTLEMLLTDPDPGNGRLLTMMLPPMEALVGVNIGGLTTGVWQALAEAAVARGATPAEDLAIAARYWQTIQQNKVEPAE